MSYNLHLAQTVGIILSQLLLV